MLPIFFILIYGLTCLGISRYYTQKAAINIHLRDFSGAEIALQRALFMLPFGPAASLFNSDNQRIQTQRGMYFLGLAKQESRRLEYVKHLKDAMLHFKNAKAINPYEVKIAKGLAESVFLLEKYSTEAHSESKNPYNALPYYENLLSLRPNGLTVHYMVARYLAFKRMDTELGRMVSRIVYLCPSDAGNGDLSKEAFYSPSLKEFIIKGVDKAIADKVRLRDACFARSRIAAEDNDTATALEFYKKGTGIQAYRNSVYTYIHLGTLFLENREFDQAQKVFLKALSISDNWGRHFKMIYHQYNKQKFFQAFSRIASEVEGRFPSLVGIYMAKMDIALGENNAAICRLEKVIAEKDEPEAFYLLARVAEMEKDWDAMASNVQKALVIDPENPRYLRSFARALYRQGKTAQAEIQADKARECSKASQN
nr:hypothetical protein [uncultured Desulfobacter sp.]